MCQVPAEKTKAHLDEVRSLHREDLERGFGDVYLPEALARKYPNAGNTYFPVEGFQLIRRPAKRAAIIFMKTDFKKQ